MKVKTQLADKLLAAYAAHTTKGKGTVGIKKVFERIIQQEFAAFLNNKVDSGCKHRRPILVSAWLGELEPDQEPYKAGEMEEMEAISCHVLLSGHYCAGCETLLDVIVEND